jgi:hypothetical protein
MLDDKTLFVHLLVISVFLRYLYYNITLNIPTCFHPQGVITLGNQITATPHKKQTSNLCIQ